MATTQVQTVSTTAEKAKLAASGVLLLAAFAAYFLLVKQGQLAQWVAFLVLLALAIGSFFISEPGKELIAFGRDAWREVKKVVWPSRKEATQMTAIVFGFVLILAMLSAIPDLKSWPCSCGSPTKHWNGFFTT